MNDNLDKLYICLARPTKEKKHGLNTVYPI